VVAVVVVVVVVAVVPPAAEEEEAQAVDYLRIRQHPTRERGLSKWPKNSDKTTSCAASPVSVLHGNVPGIPWNGSVAEPERTFD